MYYNIFYYAHKLVFRNWAPEIGGELVVKRVKIAGNC